MGMGVVVAFWAELGWAELVVACDNAASFTVHRDKVRCGIRDEAAHLGSGVVLG